MKGLLALGDQRGHLDCTRETGNFCERDCAPLAQKCSNKQASVDITPAICYLPLQQSQDFHPRSASENINKMFQSLRDVSKDKRKS